MECGAQIWHGSLSDEQSKDIERIQKRAMKIICPGKSYEQALIDCGMKTLDNIEKKTNGDAFLTMSNNGSIPTEVHKIYNVYCRPWRRSINCSVYRLK